MIHNANLNTIKIKKQKLIKLIGQRLRMMNYLGLYKKMEQETGIKQQLALTKNKYQKEMENNAEKIIKCKK